MKKLYSSVIIFEFFNKNGRNCFFITYGFYKPVLDFALSCKMCIIYYLALYRKHLLTHEADKF